MERLLDEMLRRSAIFDIVFWEGKLRVVSKRLISDYLIVFRYSSPYAEWRHRLLGVITIACPSAFIQPPCRAFLGNGHRNICFLELNGPSLARLPATNKGKLQNSV